ncbi:MAG: hypothetical protein ABJG47_17425 [Ekhidna sp.]
MKSLKEKLPAYLLLAVVAYIATTIILKDPMFFKRPFESHQFNGTYLSDKKIFGVGYAWVIDGSEIRAYSNISGKRTLSCSQSRHSLTVVQSGVSETYYPDKDGNIIIAQGKMNFMSTSIDMGIKMILVDFESDHQYTEIMTLLDTAYVD